MGRNSKSSQHSAFKWFRCSRNSSILRIIIVFRSSEPPLSSAKRIRTIGRPNGSRAVRGRQRKNGVGGTTSSEGRKEALHVKVLRRASSAKEVVNLCRYIVWINTVV